MSDTTGSSAQVGGMSGGIRRMTRDKNGRRMLIFVFLFILVAILLAKFGPGTTEPVSTSSLRSPPQLPSVQGKNPVTAEYERKMAEDTKAKSDYAAAHNNSVTPPLVLSSSTNKLPSFLPGGEDERPPQVPVVVKQPPLTLPVPAQAPVAFPGSAAPSAAHVVSQPIDANLMQAMLKQMKQLDPGNPAAAQTQYFWKPPSAQTANGSNQGSSTQQTSSFGGQSGSSSALAENMGNGSNRATTNSGTGAGNEAFAQGATGNSATRSRFIVPAAGTILYSQLLGRVNSDTPGPVVAEILQGPFAKARILGTFAFSEQGVVISFSSMTVPYTDNDGVEQTEVVPIHAVAVDSSHLGTAMATDIDRHLLEKIGVAFGTAFLQGIGQAVVQSGSTASYGVGGTTIANGSLNTSQQILAGAGSAAGAAGQVFSQAYGNKRTTIIVEADTPFGLLFLGNAN